MDDKQIAASLFSNARENIPPSSQLALNAIASSEFAQMAPENLKDNFSAAVSRLQIAAYNLYLEKEKEVAEKSILEIFRPLVINCGSIDAALSIFASRFSALDKFSLSLTQSRRSRAGSAFEVIVSELFSRLSYPYSSQPDIDGSTPDYVLPSLEWYKKYPADSIIFTLKRTLRERWRQIVTEGSSGKYYLATIDENVSKPGLQQMMNKNITLVVPENTKIDKYKGELNVISFEDFFEDHLDPAIIRWKKAGAI